MTDTSIAYVHARRVWDSRGRPTVEADVLLEGGAVGRAIAPAGASTGSARSAGFARWRHGVRGIWRQQGNRQRERADRARGGRVGRDGPGGMDERLIELDGTRNKARLGANALLSVSMATAHAAAAATGQPLYRYLGGVDAALVPLPQIQIFGGGAHAGRRVDIQDFMVMCPAAETFAQALDWTAEIYRAAGQLMEAAGPLAGIADEGGWWPAFRQTSRHWTRWWPRSRRPVSGRASRWVSRSTLPPRNSARTGVTGWCWTILELTTEGMIEMLVGWIGRYPILSIEDPLAEDDLDGFVAFSRAVGDKVQIVGDDFLVSDADRLRDAAEKKATNTVLLKPNQRGTLTETLDTRRAAAEVRVRDHRIGAIG